MEVHANLRTIALFFHPTSPNCGCCYRAESPGACDHWLRSCSNENSFNIIAKHARKLTNALVVFAHRVLRCTFTLSRRLAGAPYIPHNIISCYPRLHIHSLLVPAVSDAASVRIVTNLFNLSPQWTIVTYIKAPRLPRAGNWPIDRRMLLRGTTAPSSR